MVHFLDYVFRTRDPDGRNEAWSLCDEFEECSSSGKHSMTSYPSKVTCEKCKEVLGREARFARNRD